MSDFGEESRKFQYMVKYPGLPLYILIPPTSIFFHAVLSTCPEVVKLYKHVQRQRSLAYLHTMRYQGSINYQDFL